MDRLLEVDSLTTVFPVDGGLIRAVDGVSFHLDRGEILCIVGESGCGKSMTALSILRLVPPPGWIQEGRTVFHGRDLLKLNPEEMRRIRGDQISMVFQEPMSALNPVFTVGDQVSEVLRVHRGLDRGKAMERAVGLLKSVGIPDPERRILDYPHQMSGGMQQRVLVAMAVACEPEIIIADEPTTALDVTVQAQILRLLERLTREGRKSLLLITHDLGIVAEMADRVAVMYAGAIVETGRVEELFSEPLHPYTAGLLGSLPTAGSRLFRSIPGTVPNLAALPAGCRFHPRCPRAQPLCVDRIPDLSTSGGRGARCHFPGRQYEGLKRAIQDPPGRSEGGIA